MNNKTEFSSSDGKFKYRKIEIEDNDALMYGIASIRRMNENTWCQLRVFFLADKSAKTQFIDTNKKLTNKIEVIANDNSACIKVIFWR